jgi:hypothetical protein
MRTKADIGRSSFRAGRRRMGRQGSRAFARHPGIIHDGKRRRKERSCRIEVRGLKIPGKTFARVLALSELF